jgi:hypothetical protein
MNSREEAERILAEFKSEGLGPYFAYLGYYNVCRTFFIVNWTSKVHERDKSPEAVATCKAHEGIIGKDGPLECFIGNMCLVALYQTWDEVYRPNLAAALGRDKIDCNLMGDIKEYRHSLIHNKGEAEDMDKCKIIKWFKNGQTIKISENMFLKLLDLIQAVTIETIIRDTAENEKSDK